MIIIMTNQCHWQSDYRTCAALRNARVIVRCSSRSTSGTAQACERRAMGCRVASQKQLAYARRLFVKGAPWGFIIFVWLIRRRPATRLCPQPGFARKRGYAVAWRNYAGQGPPTLHVSTVMKLAGCTVGAKQGSRGRLRVTFEPSGARYSQPHSD